MINSWPKSVPLYCCLCAVTACLPVAMAVCVSEWLSRFCMLTKFRACIFMFPVLYFHNSLTHTTHPPSFAHTLQSKLSQYAGTSLPIVCVRTLCEKETFWAKAVVAYRGSIPHIPRGREKARNPLSTASDPTEFPTGRLSITVLEHKLCASPFDTSSVR